MRSETASAPYVAKLILAGENGERLLYPPSDSFSAKSEEEAWEAAQRWAGKVKPPHYDATALELWLGSELIKRVAVKQP